MKYQNTFQTKLFAFFCVLVFVLSTTLAVLPAVVAQDTPRKTTYPYIGLTPNPVGVNQPVLLHVGITDYLEIAADGHEGITVTVTKPDGTTETLGPFKTDSTGGTGAVYTPTLVGTYTFQTHYPEQTYVWSEGSTRGPVAGGGPVIYEASDSEINELIVTDQPITYYPDSPLPDYYWSRPINAQHWSWATIAGNWLQTPANRYAPYNDGPTTPHILWSKALATGGLIGGDSQVHAYECGDAYRGKFQSSVIINGILYYNRFARSFSGTLGAQKGIIAVDLQTGEEVWFKNNTELSFGQIFYWDNANHHSAFAYLWDTTAGTTWKAYDAFTGEWVYTMENVPSGTRAFGPNGEILLYSVNTARSYMTLWNSSNIPALYGAEAPPPAAGRSFMYYSWLPEGKTVDASAGMQWNKTIPSNLPGRANYYFEDRIIGTSVGKEVYETWGISLAPGHEGDLLFRADWTLPGGNLTFDTVAGSLEDGVFTLRAKQARQFYGFSTETGEYIWGPTETRPYLDAFTGGPSGESGMIADGKLYLGTVGGVLYCHDVHTGNLLWTYALDDPYSEILWSNNWPIEFGFATEGKVYIFHTEHSSIDPKPRGAPSVCLDSETGEVIWRVDGAFRASIWGGDPLLADSTIVMMSTYDQQIYAIGKGPSELTVTGPDTSVSLGESALLKGTVMDISAGAKSDEIAARFPSGLPCISDEDMGEWMKHVYVQFARPSDVNGVPVKMEAIDPNGNYQYLGTATSDGYGNYGFAFKPELEGTYMLIATFQGSGGYYGSTTTTYIVVDPAVSASTPIDTDEPAAELITTEVAIIAAVAAAALIGVAAYFLLKRK